MGSRKSIRVRSQDIEDTPPGEASIGGVVRSGRGQATRCSGKLWGDRPPLLLFVDPLTIVRARLIPDQITFDFYARDDALPLARRTGRRILEPVDDVVPAITGQGEGPQMKLFLDSAQTGEIKHA